METGKLAGVVYKEVGILPGSSSTGQFGDVLSVTVEGVEYEYQVKESDSLASVVRELEAMISKAKKTVLIDSVHNQIAA